MLAILVNEGVGAAVADADWKRLFESDGYRRLARREAAMGAPLTEESFRAFVLSPDSNSRAPELAAALARWKQADTTRAAKLALAYLPANARIRVRVFPVIKPRDNTFVFEPDTDAAIFFSLDPKMSGEKFENTLAHELHHIGYASCCPAKESSAAVAKLPPRVRTVLHWIGAFGEGFAMLAAAGGPDVHPHAVSDSGERARWDRDVARFDDDLRELEKFFFDVLEARLVDPSKIEARAMSFFGVQGPWYTVGWRMAVTIEKAFGRPKLLECMADPRALLECYDDAVDELAGADEKRPAKWTEALLTQLAGA